MEIKGAIFDCDGTLVNSLGFWEMYYKKIGDTFFGGEKFVPTPEDDKAMRTQAVGFLGKIMHGHYNILESEEAIINWTLDVFEWYYREVVELKAGVRELLSHLKEKGVKMCIASAAVMPKILPPNSNAYVGKISTRLESKPTPVAIKQERLSDHTTRFNVLRR